MDNVGLRRAREVGSEGYHGVEGCRRVNREKRRTVVCDARRRVRTAAANMSIFFFGSSVTDGVGN